MASEIHQGKKSMTLGLDMTFPREAERAASGRDDIVSRPYFLELQLQMPDNSISFDNSAACR